MGASLERRRAAIDQPRDKSSIAKTIEVAIATSRKRSLLEVYSFFKASIESRLPMSALKSWLVHYFMDENCLVMIMFFETIVSKKTSLGKVG